MILSIREGQYLGAVMITIAALVIYAGRLFSDQGLSFRDALPWGDQGKDVVAVELIGFQKADGVYFFPKAITLKEILNLTRIKGNITKSDPVDLILKEDIGITTLNGTVTIGGMSGLRRLSLGLPIDVNLASAEELAGVPGIGERMADQIIQLRRELGKFKKISDLTAIPGIREKRLNMLKKYLMVGSTPFVSPEQ